MFKSIWIPILLPFLISTALADNINGKNWATNPQIVEVKKIYAADQVNRAKWKKITKTWDYCQPNADTERTLICDQQGRPRIYVSAGGSDDSSVTTEHHYDESGKLRFVFIRAGAVNGSQLEHRIYFDSKSNRLWEMHKYTEGPGYTFPNPWPKENLAFDPKEAFSAPNECSK